MLLFIQNAFSVILSNQLRTTTYRLCCALNSLTMQLVLNTVGFPLEEENMVCSKQTIQNCAVNQKTKPKAWRISICMYKYVYCAPYFFFPLYFIGYTLLYLSPNVNRGDCVSFLLIAFDMKLATLHLRFCVWCSQSVSPRGQKAQCYCI